MPHRRATCRICLGLEPPRDVGIKADRRPGPARCLGALVPVPPIRQYDEIPHSPGGSRAPRSSAIGDRGPRLPGGRPVRPGQVGWIPRFQGLAVASGPIRHEDPVILAEGSPRYQAGGDVKMNERSWDLGTACTSITKGPGRTRALDDLLPGGSSRSIRQRRPGPSLPSVP